MLHRTTSWLRPCISVRARGTVATDANLHWAWNNLDSIDLEVFWVFAWDTWDHGTAVAPMDSSKDHDKTPLEKALSASAIQEKTSGASFTGLVKAGSLAMAKDRFWHALTLQNSKSAEEHGRTWKERSELIKHLVCLIFDRCPVYSSHNPIMFPNVQETNVQMRSCMFNTTRSIKWHGPIIFSRPH